MLQGVADEGGIPASLLPPGNLTHRLQTAAAEAAKAAAPAPAMAHEHAPLLRRPVARESPTEVEPCPVHPRVAEAAAAAAAAAAAVPGVGKKEDVGNCDSRGDAASPASSADVWAQPPPEQAAVVGQPAPAPVIGSNYSWHRATRGGGDEEAAGVYAVQQSKRLKTAHDAAYDGHF